MIKWFKTHWRNLSMVITWIITCCIVIFFAYKGSSVIIHYFEKSPHKQVKQINLPMSLKDSIYTEILELRIEHPEIVYSQVMHETASLTSALYKSNHNLFGMKASGNRATTSNKVVNGYKWYKTWRESLLDYALFQMAYYKGLTSTEYYRKLGASYAEDSTYIQKIK